MALLAQVPPQHISNQNNLDGQSTSQRYQNYLNTRDALNQSKRDLAHLQGSCEPDSLVSQQNSIRVDEKKVKQLMTETKKEMNDVFQKKLDECLKELGLENGSDVNPDLLAEIRTKIKEDVLFQYPAFRGHWKPLV